MYVYFDVLHSLHVVCRLIYYTHVHFCTYIHVVVIICVCQIFIKETACLFACFTTYFLELCVLLTVLFTIIVSCCCHYSR